MCSSDEVYQVSVPLLKWKDLLDLKGYSRIFTYQTLIKHLMVHQKQVEYDNSLLRLIQLFVE